MACLRLTLIQPRRGASEEVQRVLEQLDEALSGSEGLVMSFVSRMGTGKLGRVAVWQSRDAANREATREQILSLRARLQRLSLDTQEALMDVISGHVAEALDGVPDVFPAGQPAESEVT